MAKRDTRARAEGADTSTVNPALAAWPFPITPKKTKKASGYPGGEDQRETDAAGIEADERHNAADERIRVEQVDLYADPAKNVVQQIAVQQIVESPFNPRTRFDAQGLRDLAESMKGVGVMQAILVRPITLPGEVEISKGGEPQQAYEIIFGHRRYRAAQLAGLAAMPCIVRELTDAQAAQLQAIENVQRKDLDALDEARGYQHYIHVHGVSKDQLAAEIGLSRTHVYSRLKLLNAMPIVQEALRTGEIGAEVALLIARIHTPKLQVKALAAIKSKYYNMEDGGKKSFRQIRDLLAEKFALDLKGAIFDPASTSLLELAGSCTNCSKRTGNAPEYSDIAAGDQEKEDRCYWHRAPSGADICTDPDCWEAKKKAHLANKAAELEAKGKTVITGGKARAAISADGEVKGAYIPVKDVREALAKAKKTGKGGDLKPVVIQNPRDGKTKEAYAIADLVEAGVMKKEKERAAKPGTRDSWEAQRKQQEAERRQREEAAAVETKVNTAILVATRQAAAGRNLSALSMQHIALVAFRGVDWAAKNLLAKLHGVKSETALAKAIGSMAPDKLTTLLLDCALVHHVVSNGYRDEKPAALLAIAKELGVDVAGIRKDTGAKAADTRTEDLFRTPEIVEEEEAADA